MQLEDVAELCDSYASIVRGIELAEVRLQAPYTDFGGDAADIASYNARNFAGAVELAAARGLVVFGQIDFLRWTHVLSDVSLEPLLQTLRRYPAHVVPINEMLAPNALSRHTSVMGLWLTDAVDSFGIEPQSWFWQNAGFESPGLFGATNSTLPVPSRWCVDRHLLRNYSHHATLHHSRTQRERALCQVSL